MDFYVIPPLSNLELMHQGLGSRYFCLAQLYINNSDYRNFFLDRRQDNCWITLDNGAGDHDLVSADDLIEVVKELHPSEVIPPDVLFDSETTMNNFVEFIDILTKNKLLRRDSKYKLNILACPQGANLEEWLECYKFFLTNIFVDTIGFSKIAVPKAFLNKTGDLNIMEARHLAYDTLKSLDLMKKPIHLLGMGDPREMKYYLNDPLMRSTDSCNTVWSGMNEILFAHQNFNRIPTPKDYFQRVMTPSQIAFAEDNIEWFKQLMLNL